MKEKVKSSSLWRGDCVRLISSFGKSYVSFKTFKQRVVSMCVCVCVCKGDPEQRWQVIDSLVILTPYINCSHSLTQSNSLHTAERPSPDSRFLSMTHTFISPFLKDTLYQLLPFHLHIPTYWITETLRSSLR